MGHFFAQNSTLNPVGLNIYDKTKYVKSEQENQVFIQFAQRIFILVKNKSRDV